MKEKRISQKFQFDNGIYDGIQLHYIELLLLFISPYYDGIFQLLAICEFEEQMCNKRMNKTDIEF